MGRYRMPALGAACLLVAWQAHAEAPVCSRSKPYTGHVYATVSPKTAADVRTIWESEAIVVAPHDPSLSPHRVAVQPELVERWRSAGISVRVENADFQSMIDASYEKWETAASRSTAGALPSFFDKVQDLAPIFGFLDDQAGLSNARAKVTVIGQAWQNNPIKVVRISSAPDDGERATIFVTSTHHAYEWLVPMIGTGFVWALVNGYESDANVKKIVDNLNVYVLPMLNPDSFVKTRTGDRMRRTNQNPSCAGGVDLNRNWPSVGWGRGVGACGSQFYPGTRALSEPETQAAKTFADGLKKLVWYLDIHTQSQQVMIPYAWTMTKPASYARAKAFAQQYAQIIGLMAHDGYELGQGSGGGALDYFQEILDTKGGMSHVVEERGQAYDPPTDGVPPYVEKNIAAFIAVAAKLADEFPAVGSGGAGGAGGGGGSGAAGAAGTGGGGAASGSGGAGPGAGGGGGRGEADGGPAGGGGAGGPSGGGGTAGGAAGATGGTGGASSTGGGGGSRGGTGASPGGMISSAETGCGCRIRPTRGGDHAPFAWFAAVFLRRSRVSRGPRSRARRSTR